MTRELIEAAKAVIADRDHLGAMFEWEGNDVLTRPNAVRWQAFVAAVRAAEAAPVADEERVLEAASEALAALFNSNDATPDGQQRLVSDAIRPYITPAPVADTVAVPVATLRRWLNDSYVIPGMRNRVAVSMDEIKKLLPPPPAPEPSAELVAEWERDAAEYAKATHTEGGFIRPVIRGYVARARAEWAKKGGG